MASPTPTPYEIAVPQEKLDTLRAKLALASFPDELEDSGWDMGSPLADVKRLAKKWETWDWRSVEAQLNEELPMFETQVPVDGFGDVDVHFVWQRSGVVGAVPLLFVHGCMFDLYSCFQVIFFFFNDDLTYQLMMNRARILP